MSGKNRVSKKRLNQILDYDPDTGAFFRKVQRGCMSAGPMNNIPSFNGYIYMAIDGKKFITHRVAWFLVHNRWPNEIDHINGIKTDNRICNLREATRAQNEANKGLRRNNKYGAKGISYCQSRPGDKKWMAYITVNYRMKNLGIFKSKKEALSVRNEAARRVHQEFFREH